MRALQGGLRGDLPLDRRLRAIRRRNRHLVRWLIATAIWVVAGLVIGWLLFAGLLGWQL